MQGLWTSLVVIFTNNFIITWFERLNRQHITQRVIEKALIYFIWKRYNLCFTYQRRGWYILFPPKGKHVCHYAQKWNICVCRFFLKWGLIHVTIPFQVQHWPYPYSLLGNPKTWIERGLLDTYVSPTLKEALFYINSLALSIFITWKSKGIVCSWIERGMLDTCVSQNLEEALPGINSIF